MQTLSQDQFNLIHNATLKVLADVGVAFMDPDAISIFQKHGFVVDDKIVRFTEKQVMDALATAPQRFKLTARNPENSVWVGEDDWVFVPTYGAPFMVTPTGVRRPGTIQDYETFCKLVQTSRHINVNGFKHVEPQDLPAETAYLDMLLSNIVLCDKPFVGSADSRQAMRDSLEMAGMVFGGKEKLREMPVVVSLINPLSPLQYASEMSGAIIESAACRQPLMIANMVMAGASGPVNLPDLLVLFNAEILAGIVLAQLAGPGTPVIYGTTSCPINMQTGAATVGAPETAIISSLALQMARFYKLPSRTGGSLTDAGLPDAQALAEGALLLSTAVRNGANFILHSCGMIGGYIGNSLEKWIIDEELCGMVRRMMDPVDISSGSMDTDIIKRVGIGGNYLMQPETFKLCRSAFFPFELFRKKDQDNPSSEGISPVTQDASEQVIQRLGNYQKPDIDPGLETDLAKFVVAQKNK